MSRTSWGAVTAVVLLLAGGVGAAVAGTGVATEWIRKNVAAPAPKTLATDSGRVELRFPAGWSREEETPYDLQAFSRRRLAMTGVFEFQRMDLAETTTPRQVLDLQVEDLRSKRERFTPAAPEERREDGERTLTTVLHTGERGGERYYYRFTLVEFRADPEIFLVVLQVAAPEHFAKAVPVFDGILGSATVRPAAPAGPAP